MKIFSIFILLSSLTFASDIIGDFEVTDYSGSKQELRNVFNKAWGDFKSWDNNHCYRRAHVISYHLKKKLNINTYKVFFFWGARASENHNWWYHVSPAVTYKGDVVTLDKGLVEGATYLEDWTEALSGSKNCLEIYDYKEYKKRYNSETCMYMVTPMHYYGPLDLESYSNNHESIITFRDWDLDDMLFSLSRRSRRNYPRY